MHNIYRRGDMWYVDFWYNKKRYRRCIGPSRKLAGKVINKLKTEVAENRFMDPWKKSPPMKFEDFINRHYLKAVEADRRRLSPLRMLKKVFGDRVIQEISSFEIEAYNVKRKREGKA